MGQRTGVTIVVEALLVSAAFGCAHNSASAHGQGADQLPSVPESLIQMRRGGCPPGRCPVYSVAVFLDGTITYDGRANVAVLGHRTAKVPAEGVAALVIIDYRPGPIGKTVLHDETCRSAPRALGALEQAIDRVAGSERWTSSLAQAPEATDGGPARPQS